MNLVKLQEIEAHRRLKLLGTTVEDGCSAELRTRAYQVGLPMAVLRQWHASSLDSGITALQPHWEPLSEAVWVLAEELYRKGGYYRPYWFPYPQLGE